MDETYDTLCLVLKYKGDISVVLYDGDKKAKAGSTNQGSLYYIQGPRSLPKSFEKHEIVI